MHEVFNYRAVSEVWKILKALFITALATLCSMDLSVGRGTLSMREIGKARPALHKKSPWAVAIVLRLKLFNGRRVLLQSGLYQSIKTVALRVVFPLHSLGLEPANATRLLQGYNPTDHCCASDRRFPSRSD